MRQKFKRGFERHETFKAGVVLSATLGALGLLASGCGHAVSPSTDSEVQTLAPAAQPSQVPFVGKAVSLLSIQSDAGGRTPILLNLELKQDSAGELVFLSLHRQGVSSPSPIAPPNAAGDAARDSLCEKNSVAGQENCDASPSQLMGRGIVIERFFNRPGVTLRAEHDFSAAAGGNLMLRYVHTGEMQDTSRDVMGEYRLRLARKQGEWILLAPSAPGGGPINQLKLNSSFLGAYACGVDTIEASDTSNDLNQ